MGDINDILNMQHLNNALQQSIRMLRKNGEEYAKAERDYKIALNKKALELRAKEDMPVTLINKVIYGYQEIADKRLIRDIAESTYKANQEAINSYKLQIRILDNQISREWGTNE